MKTRLIVIILALFSYAKAQQLMPNNIKEVVKSLSVEEKANIVVGAGMNIPGLGPTVGAVKEKVPGAAGTTIPNTRIALPTIVLADGPAGVRIDPKRNETPNKTYYATAFPIATSLASSWNTDLVSSIGNAFGNECKEYGVDILLAPALNIHRNPLGGRNFEYYSEDPVLSGKMAAAFVRGVQDQGVGTSIKHFAANNQETNRAKINENISERALREIYLKGFEIAVKESNPWTVMSSYNKINGTYTSQSYDLLTAILRDEWGYKGLVMTDWFGGDNPVEQMKAGNDLIMPGAQKQIDVIVDAVKDGSLPIATLDKNVERILSVYVKTKAFEHYKYSNQPNFSNNTAVARSAATEGMVLLKNEGNTLPILSRTKIALLGTSSYETVAGGTGSGDVNKAYTISILDGLNSAAYTVDADLQKSYVAHIASEKGKIPPKKYFFEPNKIIAEPMLSAETLEKLAIKNQIAVITIGRTSGEFQDRQEQDDFNLSRNEVELLKAASKAFHSQGKKVVVILNIGGVIETNSWKHLADAILVAWQPGQEAGNAVADVISGKASPSGKLPMTFPIAYADSPSATTFPGIELNIEDKSEPNLIMGKPAETTYEEDIFVGYRYFDSFSKPTSYPFGFGLSYTTFKYSNMSITPFSNGKLKASCTVANTGKTSGKEVVQLYISAKNSQQVRPSKELKAFQKTKLLKKGENELVDFTVNLSDLASYNTEKAAWIVEKGTYDIILATSSDSKNALRKTISIDTDTVVSKVTNRLTPTKPIRTILQKATNN